MPLHVYSSDMCSAVFRQNHKDVLAKTLYFNGASETFRHWRSDEFELTDLRIPFRNALDLDLAAAKTSSFSPKKYWLMHRAQAVREEALRRSNSIKVIFRQALDDIRQDKDMLIPRERTIKVYVKPATGKPVEIAMGAQRIPDPKAEKEFVEKELLATLREIERTETYFSHKAPTEVQIEKFHELLNSMSKSERVQLLHKGKARSIDSENLTLGKSYLAIIAKDQLILGDGYRNGSGGTSNTHSQLSNDVGGFDVLGKAGSVRFNVDGSIDISGYHRKTHSPEAATALMDVIKRSVPPETVLRMTPGRLSEL